MAISYHTQECEFTLKGKAKNRAWINSVTHAEGWLIGDIAIVFCSDEALLKVNREYLQHDYFTDIITFDYTDADKKIVSGDLMISIDTVRENSLKFSGSFIDELDRVIIHGILHLMGYGDKTPREEKKMREFENKYLLLR